MIKRAVENFEKNRAGLRAVFAAKHPDNYKDLVRSTLDAVADAEDTWEPEALDIDTKRLEQIDHGDYQGTLVFVVPQRGYQPSQYWAVKVSYGSSSGCDTLQAISHYSDDPPTEDQLDEYMTLALHVVQGLREI